MEWLHTANANGVKYSYIYILGNYFSALVIKHTMYPAKTSKGKGVKFRTIIYFSFFTLNGSSILSGLKITCVTSIIEKSI